MGAEERGADERSRYRKAPMHAATTHFAALPQAVADFSDPVLHVEICERIFRDEKTRRAPCFCGSMVRSIDF